MSSHAQIKLIGAKAPSALHRQVRVAAARRDMTISQAVIEALEHWLAALHCPQCDQATIPHPDPLMAGVRYCPACQEPVSLDQPVQAQ